MPAAHLANAGSAPSCTDPAAPKRSAPRTRNPASARAATRPGPGSAATPHHACPAPASASSRAARAHTGGRAAEHRPDRPLLDQLAPVHHADPVTDLRHGPQIVADKQDRGPMPLAQPPHQIEDRRLDRHVEPGRRLVHDQERGPGDQRHRDHDPLLLPARKLVRVALEQRRRVGQLHLLHRLQRERPRLGGPGPIVQHRHFHELPPDRHDRVQAAHRVLIDHRDLPPAHRPAAPLGRARPCRAPGTGCAPR